ncbi:MAG: hypothetical protein HY974_00825 [Candidatus Kerfeldbacteria bacterium]|nr:hypothetical protein [Candidatus Kerfeldbacteria bacterium]
MPMPIPTSSPTSNPRQTYIIVGVVALVVIAAGLVWWLGSKPGSESGAPPAAPKPFTYTDVKGVPQEAAVEATDAKTALTLATPVAQTWNQAAKPIYIKSGADVALDGRSLTWEAAFGVPEGGKIKAYAVSIANGRVGKSEAITTSDTIVVPLPDDWSDSKDAIRRAIEILKAPELTVRKMEFYQNTGGQVWRWTLATSKGTVSMTATP